MIEVCDSAFEGFSTQPQDPHRARRELLDRIAILRIKSARMRDLRACFGLLARSIYGLNDRRAAIKRAINLASDSFMIDEKSYADGSAAVRPSALPSCRPTNSSL